MVDPIRRGRVGSIFDVHGARAVNAVRDAARGHGVAVSTAEGCQPTGDEESIAAAVAVARRADLAVVVVGEPWTMSGEARAVRFALGPAELGCYDRRMRFVVEPGEFQVWAGPSGAEGPMRSFLVVAGPG